MPAQRVRQVWEEKYWRAAGVVLSTCALVLGGCAAPYDGDGESRASMRLAPAAQQLPSATPVVVDTDLGA
ncbi:MAG TPA: hypothetical protein VFL94_09385, partial [Actinomycetales bacterium]|nr:hypothetical protein [Actinomycetales bacterium]